MLPGIDPTSVPLLVLLFDIVANKVAGRLIYGDQEAKITPTQAKIIKLLMDHPHRVFAREKIIEEADLNQEIFDLTVLSHLSKPRRTLTRMTGGVSHIVVVYGDVCYYEPYPFNHQRITGDLWQVIIMNLVHTEGSIPVGPFLADLDRHRLFYGNRYVHLTKSEKEALAIFLDAPRGRIITAPQIATAAETESSRHPALVGNDIFRRLKAKIRLVTNTATADSFFITHYDKGYELNWAFLEGLGPAESGPPRPPQATLRVDDTTAARPD